MWVFLNNAFLSIVEDRSDSDMLRVRARIAGDIERVFPGVSVIEPRVSDYRFHARVPRSEVVRVMSMRVAGITYDDFKSSVHEHKRHDAYLDVWRVMHQVQPSRLDVAERTWNR